MAPKKGVTLTLDRERSLRITWRSLERLEEEHDIDLEGLGESLRGGGTLASVRRIIWLGLLHEDPEITPDGVADLLDDYGDFSEVVQAANALIGQVFGGASGNGQGATSRAKASRKKKTKK